MATKQPVPRLSRKGFRAWLLTQPPGRRFFPICSLTCALSRYLQDQGFRDARACSDHYECNGVIKPAPKWVETFHYHMFAHPTFGEVVQRAKPPKSSMWECHGADYLTTTQLLECLKRS